jgi:arylsulfatase
MTDNGGTAGCKVYNAGMRGQKGTSYNGGTHVPCLIRWDGVFPAGVKSDALTAHVDFFPTIADITGAPVPDDVKAKWDGRSLLPLLKDPKSPWPDRLLFTHVGRWAQGKAEESKYAHCAVRNTQYNMVCMTNGPKKWELYDLKADAGETKDLSAEKPDVVKELDAAYDHWWQSILPDLVNENALGNKEMPFKIAFEKQFGKTK